MRRDDLLVRRAAGLACALMLFAAQAASAQESASKLALGRDVVEWPSIGRVIFVFFIVAGLAVGAAFALRRYSPNLARGLAQAGPLRVISRSTLNAGLRVHLIEVEGERILVAENRGGVSLLQLRQRSSDSDQGSAT